MATNYSAAAIYEEIVALYGPKVMSKKGTIRFVHFKFNVNIQQKITLTIICKNYVNRLKLFQHRI